MIDLNQHCERLCQSLDCLIKSRLLLPMIKRNQNIPDIGGDVDDGVLADLMIDKFIGTYIPVSSRGWFDSFEHSKILPN